MNLTNIVIQVEVNLFTNSLNNQKDLHHSPLWQDDTFTKEIA